MKKIALVLALMSASSALAANEYSIGLAGGLQQISVSAIKSKTEFSNAGYDFLDKVAKLKTQSSSTYLSNNFDTISSKSGSFAPTGEMKVGYLCWVGDMGVGAGGSVGFSGANVKPEFSTLLFSKDLDSGYQFTDGTGAQQVQLVGIGVPGKNHISIKSRMSFSFGGKFAVKVGSARLTFGASWLGQTFKVSYAEQQMDADRKVTGQINDKKSRVAHAVQLSFGADAQVSPNMLAGIEASYAFPAKVKFQAKKEFTLAQMDSSIKFKPKFTQKIQSFKIMATLSFLMSR
jgi:hypothetical protein